MRTETLHGNGQCHGLVVERDMLDSRNLRSMADHCRNLASTRQTPEAMRALLQMAERYERQASEHERERDPAQA